MGRTRQVLMSAVLAAVLVVAAAAVTETRADDKPIVMKIALATLDDVLHQYAKNYAAAIERDSGGRIKPEIYPASQLGSIERQTEGVQFGAIQCQLVAPEFLVGIDERFEVLAAPALVKSMAQGQRLAADPAVQKLMLGLGADKGLHGAGLVMSAQSAVVARNPIRHLADFKGKKIRIFASQFESVAMARLGATPKSMTLGPGAAGAAGQRARRRHIVHRHLQQPCTSRARRNTSPRSASRRSSPSSKSARSGTMPCRPILQQIVDKDAAAEAAAINPQAIAINDNARKAWIAGGGELISLPADEQASLLKIVAGVGDEVSATKPQLGAAYQIVTEAAQRLQ